MISPITTVRISTSITAANNIRFPASVTSNPCWQCRGTASTAAAAEFDHGMVLRRTFPIRGSVLRAHSKILFRHENSTTRRYLSTCSAELPPRRNPNALIPLYSRMKIGEVSERNILMFTFLSGSYNCYEYIRLNQSANEKDDFPHHHIAYFHFCHTSQQHQLSRSSIL
ncbi:uncharacterized protein LOC129767744 [Toxorhynchites rutilus septentrionalis]|uniref:uncharacterized protein LOC129767744 n=1 Tax=Toxorhynchites rutilus septentrionalis TaxID=329112 RepID=UPI002478999E|nr:uncharacterized protein LOC129767744 [Toxorhynchites rutilus septentrionalis]